jgi:hypothetical protein
MAQNDGKQITEEDRAAVASDLRDVLQDWGGVYSDADQMQMDADFFAEEDAAELARDGGY